MTQRRETKKQETRQRISDVATALFFAHGFDAVTVEEIAVASGVSKMTVFNYFARKEELLLDREDDLKLLPFREAIRGRAAGQAPIDALQAAARAMAAARHPLFHLDRRVLDWWRVVAGSPALKARLRELADEAAELLAIELGGPAPDATARLAAAMIVATVRTARDEAMRQIAGGVSAKRANAAFLDLLERGLTTVGRLPGAALEEE